nr:ATP:cob(I)alamin adenosyltransferase [Candidatus Marsarchaeota archaeon]
MSRTHNGDTGFTSIIEKRVAKNSSQIRALGALDELNAWIDLCNSFSKGSDKKILYKIRNDLRKISFCVAGGKCDVEEKDVNFLENESLKIDSKFKVKNFVDFEGYGWFFNIARTVCRRAELELLNFSPPDAKSSYLNRLSTLLFSLAVKSKSTSHRTLLGNKRKP